MVTIKVHWHILLGRTNSDAMMHYDEKAVRVWRILINVQDEIIGMGQECSWVLL